MYRSQQYSLTLTLKPYLYKETAINQLLQSQDSIITVLKNPSLNCDGLVVAELTKQFNIHYHGYIYFNTKLKYPQEHLAHLIKQLKPIGRFEIEPVSNQLIWEKYCIKELYKTADILSIKTPIIFNQRDKTKTYDFFDVNTDLITHDSLKHIYLEQRAQQGTGTVTEDARAQRVE